MGDLLQRAAPADAGQRTRRHRHRAGHRGTLPDGARRVIQGPRSGPECPVRVPDWSYRQRDSGAGRSLHRLRPRPCEGLRDQGLPGAGLRAAGPAGPGAASSHSRGAIRAECRDPRIAGRVAAADLSHASEPPDEGRHREAIWGAGNHGSAGPGCRSGTPGTGPLSALQRRPRCDRQPEARNRVRGGPALARGLRADGRCVGHPHRRKLRRGRLLRPAVVSQPVSAQGVAINARRAPSRARGRCAQVRLPRTSPGRGTELPAQADRVARARPDGSVQAQRAALPYHRR